MSEAADEVSPPSGVTTPPDPLSLDRTVWELLSEEVEANLTAAAAASAAGQQRETTTRRRRNG